MELEQENRKEKELQNTANQELEQEINRGEEVSVGEKQNAFLESTLGKVINTGVDIALRAILPNAIEDEVIRDKKRHHQ